LSIGNSAWYEAGKDNGIKNFFMRKKLFRKILFLSVGTGLVIFGIWQTCHAESAEIYSFTFDWYGVRLIFVVLGILLGGLIIKPIRGFFGAIGGGFTGLFVAAWIGNNSLEGLMNFIIIGSIPTAILGGLAGILAQIYKSYGKNNS
jgi:hypothetical protein